MRIMDLTDTPRSVRHDGWTDARKIQFLYEVAACGNVRAACAHVGLSAEAAYKLRRRDALFARAWAAALVLGREASAQVLECRALDGVEEAVWYRGEVVGHRRRYDNRLLLAHMARLDAQAETGLARDDAARFDELLACVGGTAPPDGLATDADGLPLTRAASIEHAGEQAERAVWDESDDDDDDTDDADGEADAYDRAARTDELIELAVTRFREGRIEGAARWDAWARTAYAAVDRTLAGESGGENGGGDFSASTPSTSSTSPAAIDESLRPPAARSKTAANV
jgi:hypothetical protein